MWADVPLNHIQIKINTYFGLFVNMKNVKKHVVCMKPQKDK